MATRGQLADAELVDEFDKPVRPWHPIQGPSDASTMWYAVMVKQEKGIFIGALVFRHSARFALLGERGWTEVEVPQIGVTAG